VAERERRLAEREALAAAERSVLTSEMAEREREAAAERAGGVPAAEPLRSLRLTDGEQKDRCRSEGGWLAMRVAGLL